MIEMSKTDPLRRLGGLLLWHLRYSARQDWVWRAATYYILLAGPMLFTTLFTGNVTSLLGEQALNRLRLIHVVMAVGFAANRAAISAADRPSGLLGLVMLADIPSRQWILYRMLALLADYVLLWLLRLPFYAFAIGAGGSWSTILHMEVLQWSVFFAVASATLLAARFVHIPSGAIMVSVALFALWALVPLVPYVVILAVRELTRMGSSPPMQGLHHIAVKVFQLSPFSHLQKAGATMEEWGLFAGSVFLQLGFAAMMLRLLRRTLYFQVDTAPTTSADASPRAESKMTRTSRRVWDDAFAWQAFEYHSGGQAAMYRRFWFYGIAVVIGLVALMADRSDQGLFILALFAFQLISVWGATSCLGGIVRREAAAGTISSLRVLPTGEMEIYRGWYRGARRYVMADLLCALFCMATLMIVGSPLAPISVILAAMAWLCAPIRFVSVTVSGAGFLAFPLVGLMSFFLPVMIAFPWTSTIACVTGIASLNHLALQDIERALTILAEKDQMAEL